MNLLKSSHINFLWTDLIVEELVRNGADYFCVAPGSRSAPLAVAVSRNPRAKAFVHFDERGLGFHALGYTAATRRPAVIITTSGTAVANLFPAVIEAAKKKLPLILLTADRPPELRKAGANQTIDQPGIFGPYARWSFDMPCPTTDIGPEFVLTTMDQAVHQTRTNPPAPVHVNCMFREPLAPEGQTADFSEYLKPLERWLAGSTPYTDYVVPERTIPEDRLEDILARIRAIKSGIIAVGKLSGPDEREAVLKLSEKLYWPIVPDITSGLRLGNQHQNVIHYFDQLLLDNELMKQIPVDGVIHIGGRMTSKRWYPFIESRRPKEYIMVLNHPLRNDPLHNVTARVDGEIGPICQSLAAAIPARKDNKPCFQLQSASQGVKETIETFLTDKALLSEPAVARLVSKYLPADSTLFLANSMPIRDMDMYAAEHKNPVLISANRGASGIDGNIAAAAGFAKGAQTPLTLMIGDLAFLHDLNSLGTVKSLDQPAVIVVLNNNGGGIFSFLPVADVGEGFEKYFGTPHHLTFDHAAQLFHLDYVHPKTPKEFTAVYQQALKTKTSTVIEIINTREDNLKHHQDIQGAILEKLKKYRKG